MRRRKPATKRRRGPLTRPPATAPLSEKARPGSHGNASGVATPPASKPSQTAPMIGARGVRPGAARAIAIERRDRQNAATGRQHAPIPGNSEFDGCEHGAFPNGERDGAHLCLGLHLGGKEGGQIGGAHRTEARAKAARLPDPVGGDARGRELGQDKAPVGNDLGQPRLADQPCDFLGAERALAGGAPDVDAARVDHQQPGVEFSSAERSSSKVSL